VKVRGVVLMDDETGSHNESPCSPAEPGFSQGSNKLQGIIKLKTGKDFSYEMISICNNEHKKSSL